MEPPSNGRLSSLARQIYDEKIRAVVELQHAGEFLVLDVESGDYELDPDEVSAFDRAVAKHPGGKLFIMRVGYPTAHKLGGHFKAHAR